MAAVKKITKALNKAEDADEAWAALGALQLFNETFGTLTFFSNEALERADELLEILFSSTEWLSAWKSPRAAQKSIENFSDVINYYVEGEPEHPRGNPGWVKPAKRLAW